MDLERIKNTLALDLSIAMKQGLPPKACIEFLTRTPEFGEALELRSIARQDRDGKWHLPE
jgi:hypothetical protein